MKKEITFAELTKILEEMAKIKTPEEKQLFIEQNRAFIPERQIQWFSEQPLAKQYEKILCYIRTHKGPSSTRLNVKSEIKRITDKKPTTAQLQKIIDGLNEWLNTAKDRQIAEIDKQIQVLLKQKENLNK